MKNVMEDESREDAGRYESKARDGGVLPPVVSALVESQVARFCVFEFFFELLDALLGLFDFLVESHAELAKAAVHFAAEVGDFATHAGDFTGERSNRIEGAVTVFARLSMFAHPSEYIMRTAWMAKLGGGVGWRNFGLRLADSEANGQSLESFFEERLPWVGFPESFFDCSFIVNDEHKFFAARDSGIEEASPVLRKHMGLVRQDDEHNARMLTSLEFVDCTRVGQLQAVSFPQGVAPCGYPVSEVHVDVGRCNGNDATNVTVVERLLVVVSDLHDPIADGNHFSRITSDHEVWFLSWNFFGNWIERGLECLVQCVSSSRSDSHG